MMVECKAGVPIPTLPIKMCRGKRGKSEIYVDAVFVFDSEATTFFLVGGEWKSEKYTTLEERKNAPLTLGIVYAWALKTRGLTVYGRTRSDLAWFLSELDEINPMKKIIWVHNLNYDYSFFSDILVPNPAVKRSVIARAKMSPLKIDVLGYNIELRDSYALCNMSLEKVGTAYNCGKKLKGDLDYTEAHLPCTPLTLEELEYLERDVDVLYNYIYQEWYEKYNHDWLQIPLTQTGVPRRLCKELLSQGEQGKRHMKHMKRIMPRTVEEYKLLHEPFAGGVAHCNYLYATDDADDQTVVKDVITADINSDYPYQLVSKKFPCTGFVKLLDPDDIDVYSEDCAYIATVTFHNLQQRCAWDYISYSKCRDVSDDAVVDNGRIASCSYCTIRLTNIDIQIINDVYSYDSADVIEAYSAKLDYLPLKFVNLVLDLYGNKTKMKHSDPALYMYSKQILNSLYGMLCTDICKEDIFLENGEWSLEYERITESMNERNFSKADIDAAIYTAMEKKLKKNNPFLPYSAGVFVTAYARRDLFSPIIHYNPDIKAYDGIMNDAVYTDTDSVKFINEADNIKYINEHNAKVRALLNKVATDRGIDPAMFSPTDKPGGTEFPLGIYDIEDHYDDFVSMGSKKYCYHENGKFGFVVAGLQKKYVDADGEHPTMTSMSQMAPGVHIPHARTNYVYSTSQPLVELTDYMGNKYVNDYERGVSMWRTDYTFSLANDYAALLDDDDFMAHWAAKCYNDISSPLSVQIERSKNERKNTQKETAV